MYIRLGLAKYFLVKSYKLRRELCAKRLVHSNFERHWGIYYRVSRAPNLVNGHFSLKIANLEAPGTW